jgi:virginiamycin B lyase
MINPTSHAITEYPVGVTPYDVCIGPDGNLWATTHSDSLLQFNLTTHVSTTYSSALIGLSYYCVAGPDGNLWFTDQANNKIGMITDGALQAFEWVG